MLTYKDNRQDERAESRRDPMPDENDHEILDRERPYLPPEPPLIGDICADRLRGLLARKHR